jgi:ribosome maturation factor RimP
MTEDFKKLMEHADQIARRENCFLYDLEMPGSGQGRTLRVFIDKDGEEGVSIDDCQKVSQGLNLLLDVEDLVPGGAYNLEVSSPGLERRLRQAWHFQKALGETIVIQLNRGLGEWTKTSSPKDVKKKEVNSGLEGR